MDYDDTPSNCGPFVEDCSCHDTYQFYGFHENLVLGLLASVLIVFGVACNLLSVRIFTHPLMSATSINWYLTVLSLTDTVTLLMAFFVLTLPRLGELFGLWSATRLSYSIVPFSYALMTLAQTVSVWTTVALSIHRFIGVSFPFKAQDWLNGHRVKCIIGCVLGFSVCFNLSRFFEVQVVNNCFRRNINNFIHVISPTPLRMSPWYQLIFFGWAYTIVMFLIPFIILIVVNAKVLLVIRRQNRLQWHKSSNQEYKAMSRRAEAKERQTTVMLVALVAVFLACNTLALLSNVLENLGDDQNEIYPRLVTYNNFMVMVNASTNVFIFLLFSEKYRVMIRRYLRIRTQSHKTDSQLITNGPIFL